MKMKYLLMGVVCVGLVSFANAAIIGTDSFDYGDGTVIGQDGGTGWDRVDADSPSSWRQWYGDATPDVASGQLTTNNTVAVRDFGPGLFDPDYSNPVHNSIKINTGQLYVKFTMTAFLGSNTDWGWGGMSITDGGNEWGLFGRTWGNSYYEGEEIYSDTPIDGSAGLGYYGTTREDAHTSIPIVPGVAAEIIACVDVDNDKILMWVNPDASDYHNISNGNNSADLEVFYEWDNWLSGVRLGSGGAMSWDDLVVATDGASVGIVPEPATLAILGFGALLGLKRKK